MGVGLTTPSCRLNGVSGSFGSVLNYALNPSKPAHRQKASAHMKDLVSLASRPYNVHMTNVLVVAPYVQIDGGRDQNDSSHC